MSSSPSRTDASDLHPIVNAFISTLDHERTALQRLSSVAEDQLNAIRQRKLELLAPTTQQINETVGELDQLRKQRERRQRMVGKALDHPVEFGRLEEISHELARKDHRLGTDLLDAIQSLKEQASMTQARCSELEFGLQYAIQLGQDILETLQQIDAPAGRIYTATGNFANSAHARTFVNKLG